MPVAIFMYRIKDTSKNWFICIYRYNSIIDTNVWTVIKQIMNVSPIKSIVSNDIYRMTNIDIF